MALADLGLELRRLQAPLPIWHGVVHRAAWSTVARTIADSGGRLVSVWGIERRTAQREMAVCAAYAVSEGLVWVELRLDDAIQSFPDLSAAFPCAGRMQRAMTDLQGLHAEGSHDSRPWLDHGLWPPGPSPLRHEAQPQSAAAGRLPADYPFVRVEGDGVHEIAVGPVHAGIIEPGHWRFSVVGEKVLRLEAHLGYTHKGIERRFTELAPLDACRLAGRVSGDTTVAYAWAYCMALESAWRCEIPARATWLRALMLERERVANHLGDLGALGNDAALAFGLAQFSRLREDWLRLSKEAFAHRLMMDAVVPGGVASDLPSSMLDRLRRQCDEIEREVRALRVVYDEHAGLQDRFRTTGQVTPQLGAQLGLTGLAGRASGQSADLRCDQEWSPYDQFEVTMATHRDGDIAARVAVRFEETFESLRLIRNICSGLPDGTTRADLRVPDTASIGAGWVEGWRGEVFVALEIGDDGRIVRCHCHDPSWQNWPILEHAMIGNIVPDFPLINKSFNLSYSGHDL
ncbi:MAG: NADH-quinone oxidoreductase subunit C [Rhodoferax sp.]|nr:NADH-quinone oxidoreductase subunit C [Rhodoferax sp.]